MENHFQLYSTTDPSAPTLYCITSLCPGGILSPLPGLKYSNICIKLQVIQETCPVGFFSFSHILWYNHVPLFFQCWVFLMPDLFFYFTWYLSSLDSDSLLILKSCSHMFQLYNNVMFKPFMVASPVPCTQKVLHLKYFLPEQLCILSNYRNHQQIR